MQLSHLVPGSQIQGRLQDLIARIGLVEGQPPITPRAEFDVRNARGVRAHFDGRSTGCSLVACAGRTGASGSLAAGTGTWPVAERHRCARRAVGRDVCWGFYGGHGLDVAPEFPRYLSAVRLRLEKLKNGGLAKDAKLSAPIAELERVYQQLARGTPHTSADAAQKLQDVRWMLEELRVSIFAQQLGTKQPVSHKRIRELLRVLES